MANVYVTGMKAIGEGSAPWVTGDLRVALLKGTYVFDETDDFLADVVAHELAGGNYARVALTSKASIADDAGHQTKFDADDTVFPALALAAGQPAHAVIYVHNADPAAAQLLCCCTLVSPPPPNGGDYRVVWGVDGIFTISN